MAVAYNFRKGADLVEWDWLDPCPVTSQPGAASVYDGNRFIYWALQSGTASAGVASTTQLYRYDTWSDGWQFLATLTNGNDGIDLEYDHVRGVVFITDGVSLTTWRVFNPNTTAVTVCNTSCAAMAVTAIATALPAVAAAGSSLTMPNDVEVPATIDTGTADASATATTVTDSSSSPGSFGPGLVGCQVRYTSGTLIGLRRLITAVPSPTSLTVNTFGSAPVVGDTYVIELPSDTAAVGSTASTLVTTGSLPTNYYVNSDVVILSGTGAGQRRRIASHDATTLTLAGAVTGNSRTGNWSVTPDNTSVYQIVPSSDFLYYQPGGTTGLYKIDVVQTTGSAWSALLGATPAATGGGANTVYPGSYDPFAVFALRGVATASVYRYGIGPNAWTTLTTFAASETFTTGAAASMVSNKRRFFVQKEGSLRCHAFDLTTGILETAGMLPYTAPVANGGHRGRHVTDPNGVDWMYVLRAGGQEFFRVPLEWM